MVTTAVDSLFDKLLTLLQRVPPGGGMGFDPVALAGWMGERHWRVRQMISERMGAEYEPTDKAIVFELELRGAGRPRGEIAADLHGRLADQLPGGKVTAARLAQAMEVLRPAGPPPLRQDTRPFVLDTTKPLPLLLLSGAGRPPTIVEELHEDLTAEQRESPWSAPPVRMARAGKLPELGRKGWPALLPVSRWDVICRLQYKAAAELVWLAQLGSWTQLEVAQRSRGLVGDWRTFALRLLDQVEPELADAMRYELRSWRNDAARHGAKRLRVLEQWAKVYQQAAKLDLALSDYFSRLTVGKEAEANEYLATARGPQAELVEALQAKPVAAQLEAQRKAMLAAWTCLSQEIRGKRPQAKLPGTPALLKAFGFPHQRAEQIEGGLFSPRTKPATARAKRVKLDLQGTKVEVLARNILTKGPYAALIAFYAPPNKGRQEQLEKWLEKYARTEKDAIVLLDARDNSGELGIVLGRPGSLDEIAQRAGFKPRTVPSPYRNILTNQGVLAEGWVVERWDVTGDDGGEQWVALNHPELRYKALLTYSKDRPKPFHMEVVGDDNRVLVEWAGTLSTTAKRLAEWTPSGRFQRQAEAYHDAETLPEDPLLIRPSKEQLARSIPRSAVQSLEKLGILDSINASDPNSGRGTLWKFEREAYDDLVIEWVQTPAVFKGWMLSIAHYREQNGDRFADIEIVFEVKDGYLGRHAFAAVGSMPMGRPRQDKTLARTFMKNLRDQRWGLEHLVEVSGTSVDPRTDANRRKSASRYARQLTKPYGIDLDAPKPADPDKPEACSPCEQRKRAQARAQRLGGSPPSLKSETPGAMVWRCQTCGTTQRSKPTQHAHVAVGSTYCPSPDWRLVHPDELSAKEQEDVQAQLAEPCGTSMPLHAGRSCSLRAGHTGAHKGLRPPQGRERKDKDAWWWDGSAELLAKRPTAKEVAAHRAKASALEDLPERSGPLALPWHRDDGFEHRLGRWDRETPPPSWPLPMPEDTDLRTEARRRKANIEAVQLLQRLQAEERLEATPAEVEVLRQFSGWGGVNTDKVPQDLLPEELSGVLYQYFTPTMFCDAVWGLLARLKREGVLPADPAVLEPSVGIGRFVASAPAGLDWTCVEYHADVFRLFTLVQPEAEAFHGPFEAFVRTHGDRRFDLVVANPPYTGRGGFVELNGRRVAVKNVDPKGRKWAEAADYFMSATARMLAPGGIMCHLVPQGFLTGKDSRLRTELAKSCRFLGAYLPPADMFPGARLNLCFVLLQKREQALARVEPIDRDFVAGKALQQPEAYAVTVGGTWAAKQRQSRWAREAGKLEREVVGAFDPLSLIHMDLRKPLPVVSAASGDRYGYPAEQFRDLRIAGDQGVSARDRAAARARLVAAGVDVEEGLARVTGDKPPAKRGQKAPRTARKAPRSPRKSSGASQGGSGKRGALAVVEAQVAALPGARALGERFIEFRDLVRSNPTRAAAGRLELLADIRAWIARHGNPHKQALVLEAQLERPVAAFLSAVSKNGTTFAQVLVQDAVNVNTAGYRGPRNHVNQIVAFLCARHGEATMRNVLELFAPTGAMRTPMDEVLDLVRRAGQLCVQVEGPNYTLWTAEAYGYGKLYERLDHVRRGAPVEWLRPFYARQEKLLIEAVDPLPIEAIELDPRSGFIPVQALSDWLTKSAQRDVVAEWREGILFVEGDGKALVADLVAFINREAFFEDTDSKGRLKRTRRQKGELDERMQQDAETIGAFNAFVRRHPVWRERLQEAYNRHYRGVRQRRFSTEQVPLLRAGSNIRLNPHQNEAVYRVVDARGGVIAHDVGLGKTFEALAAAAFLRQQGLARKPLITVPKQVLTNWLLEADVLLPGYNVGTIGITRNPDTGEIREDNKATKARKWQLYANGAWDITICSYPVFEQVPVKPSTEKRLFESNFWLQRLEAQHSKEQDYTQRLLESKRKQLEESRRDLENITVRAAASEKRLAEQGPRRNSYDYRYNSRRDDRDRDAKKLAQLKKRVRTQERAVATLEKKVEKGASAGTRKIEQARQKHDEWVANRQFLNQGDYVYWEDLGCDFLIIDEFHNYKNLLGPESRYGKVPKYLGGAAGDTKRCWDLWLKATHLREQHEGSGVLGLTATPLKNSPIEIFNLLQYVRPELFERLGIRSHEEFIDRFVSIGQDFVLTANGDVEAAPIVAGYQQLVELRAILALIMDYKVADDVGLKLPEARPETIVVPMTGHQQDYYSYLRQLGAEAMRSQEGTAVDEDGNEVHYLSILDKMRKAALDMRLTPRGGDGSTPEKYKALVRNVQSLEGCAHIVFVDSVQAHKWVIDALVAGGVDESRIGRIYGKVKAPDRQKVAQQLNGTWRYEDGKPVMVKAPEIDVVIGNSPTMAEGLNLQRRACAIHHLELPWEPATLQQRNGRGVRQGNVHEAVDLFYYLSERSLDGYRLQLISGKRNWMMDLLRGTDNQTNNPMAEDMSAGDFKVMFAASEGEAKAAMAEARTAAVEEAERRKRARALKDFATYVLKLDSARRQRDPDFASRLRSQAQDLRAELERRPDEVFPYKHLLDRARDIVIFIEPESGAVYMEKSAVCLQDKSGSQLAWVHGIDPTRRTVSLRKFGTWPAKVFAFKALQTYKPMPECSWDAAQDHADRHAVDDYRRTLTSAPYVDWASRIPDELLDPEFWPTLWQSIRQKYAYGRDEWKGTLPFVMGGRLFFGDFADYNVRQARGDYDRAPIMPTEDGWELFVSLLPTAPSRKVAAKVARDWWRRPLPREEKRVDAAK